MYRKLADTIVLDFTVHLPTTGAVSDADELPTVEVWEDETDTTLSGATVTKRVGKTGNYRVAVAATAANGFEVGKSYNVVVTAIAGGVTAKAVIGCFAIDGKRLSDLNDIPAPDLSKLDVAVSTRAAEAAGNVAAIKTQTDKLVFTAAGFVDADAKKLGGTTQTGRDIGASVLLSHGTGDGQLDITSGVVKANLVQILGSLISDAMATAGVYLRRR